jgi:hypothetical protein
MDAATTAKVITACAPFLNPLTRADGVDIMSNTNGSLADFLMSTKAGGAMVDRRIDVTADLGIEQIAITGGPQVGGGDGDAGTIDRVGGKAGSVF